VFDAFCGHYAIGTPREQWRFSFNGIEVGDTLEPRDIGLTDKAFIAAYAVTAPQ